MPSVYGKGGSVRVRVVAARRLVAGAMGLKLKHYPVTELQFEICVRYSTHPLIAHHALNFMNTT